LHSKEHDVAIVGYGPVAALLALELAAADLRVVVLERSTEPVVLPRAVGLGGDSVRAFQRLGFGDEVGAICQAARDVDRVVFANSHREPIFEMTMPKFGEHGWRDMAFFDQPELEALLRDIVSRDDRIDVLFGHEVRAVEQGADGIVVRSTSGAEKAESVHQASYVIGCDGASSFVRQHLGIDWESLGYDQDWLVVDIIQGPDANLPLATMQVCDPARLTTYVCVKDPNRRWEFQLLEGEDRHAMLEPEKIHELIEPWTARENYEIRRAAVYQFHAATADRWQVDRVFLAGDAAHQTPPFLGQGLNAGFRDAVNLGWKIPLVLSGRCDARLLETYQAERDAHAKDLVEWAVAIGQLMETLAAREAGLPDPYAVDQSSGYGQGRTAPPMRGGVLMMEQAGDEKAAIGTMLRQPTVRDESGKVFRLDEVFGSSFAVVAKQAGALKMGADAAAVLDRVGGRVVSVEGLEIVDGEWDRVFESYAAVVLRPDRYLFGVVDDDWSLDALLLELGRKLSIL
jgi:3-(3-hydroxy-phenyl)propionate hydroxylase